MEESSSLVRRGVWDEAMVVALDRIVEIGLVTCYGGIGYLKERSRNNIYRRVRRIRKEGM